MGIKTTIIRDVQRKNYALDTSIEMEEDHFKSDNPEMTTGYRLRVSKTTTKLTFESCFLLKDDLLYLFKAGNFHELIAKSGEYFLNRNLFGVDFFETHSDSIENDFPVTITVIRFLFDTGESIDYSYSYSNGLLISTVRNSDKHHHNIQK